MINKINIYFLLQIIKSFTLVFFIFISISWLLQLTRLFSLTNLVQINIINVLQLSLFLIPNIMSVIIPFILIFGIILCFVKLNKDKELIAIYSLGMQLKPIKFSLIIFSILIFIIQLLLISFISPKVYKLYKFNEFELRNTINFEKVILSNFLKINKNTTIDFKKIDNSYNDILISFVDENENLIFAKKGLIENQEGNFTFQLQNGFKVSIDNNNNNIEKLKFDNYVLKINKNNNFQFNNYDKNTLTIFDDLEEKNYFNIIIKFVDIFLPLLIIYFFYQNNVLKINFSLKNNIFFSITCITLLIINQFIKNSGVESIVYSILILATVLIIFSVIKVKNVYE